LPWRLRIFISIFLSLSNFNCFAFAFVSISKVSHYLDSSQTQTYLFISLTSHLFTFAQAFFTSAETASLEKRQQGNFWPSTWCLSRDPRHINMKQWLMTKGEFIAFVVYCNKDGSITKSSEWLAKLHCSSLVNSRL
jgi:hypothetical protein